MNLQNLTRRLSPAALLTAVGIASLATGLAACGSGGDNSSGDEIRVVATTTQVGDLARNVGGDRVRVIQLLTPNTDPHDYEPRPSDVRATANARVVLVSGAGLDNWAGGLVERSGGKPRTVDLAEGLPVEREGGEPSHEEEQHEEEQHEQDAHEEGAAAEAEVDPHWWHDPRNAGAAVERIRDELIRADPEAADEYRANAQAYREKLGQLDAGIARCVDAVPAGQRKLVTDHDAFGYFADRYDIDVVGTVIPSQTTTAQASADDVAKLAAVIEREDVQAIFPETSLNPAVAKALADQTGTTAEYTLYGDTLGPQGSTGSTYLTMERANAEAVVRGLTGGRRGCQIASLG